MANPDAGKLKVHVLRLHPGQEMLSELRKYIHGEQIHAAVILSAVGSVRHIAVRFAHRPPASNQVKVFDEYLELVSLVGMMSIHGHHIHICLSDADGKTIGGHLVGEAIVFTTMEVALGVMEDRSFLRIYDPATGYPELVVQQLSKL